MTDLRRMAPPLPSGAAEAPADGSSSVIHTGAPAPSAPSSISIHLDGTVRSMTIEMDLVGTDENAAESATVASSSDRRRWITAHPYLYAEGGDEAFLRAKARQQHVVATWVVFPVVAAIVAAFSHVPPPGGLLSTVVVIAIGATFVGALAVVPSVLLMALPAMIHATALDHRDERRARWRAEPRERRARLALETAANDRRLQALGIEL